MSALLDIPIWKNCQSYSNWNESICNDKIFSKIIFKQIFFQKFEKTFFEKKIIEKVLMKLQKKALFMFLIYKYFQKIIS